MSKYIQIFLKYIKIYQLIENYKYTWELPLIV